MGIMKKQELSIIIANPSGNVTIFVLTPIDESQYTDVANKLLEFSQFDGEQVCFIKEINFDNEIQGCMSMSGLEFCGNATRSFALYIAKQQGLTGRNNIKVSVSGVSEPLDVLVNTSIDRAEVLMPKPKSIEMLKDQELSYLSWTTLVEFDGITHIILNDIPASQEIFDNIKNSIMKTRNPAALGVMFYNTETRNLTPIVYVRDVDTTYWEGSCASGTTALCLSLSLKYTDGIHMYTVVQPAGQLMATIEKCNNEVTKITIDGIVSLSEVQTVIV